MFSRVKWIVVWALVLSICGCGGGHDDSSPPATAPSITAQPEASGKAVGDALTLSVVATGSGPLRYQWQRNDADIAGATEASYTTGALSADDDGARFTVKVSNAVGSVTSAAVVLSVTREVKDPFNGGPPTVSFSTIHPASGDSLTVKVAQAGATSISLTPVGEGCGTLQAATARGGVLEATGAVGAVGSCVLTAEVATAGGVTAHTNEFTVTARNVDNQGISFKNGIYFPSGTFAANVTNSTSINQVTIPQAFINGGSGAVYVDVANTALATKAVIRIAGVPGYYVVNGTIDSGRLRYDMDVAPLFLKDGAATSQRVITAQLVGSDGGLSQPASATASFQRVGSGPLQISLSFDQSEDVDLHVVTPDNEEIYYDSKTDSTGGVLDLDSNPACRLDNVNNENIVWLTSASPKAGVYKVRVDLYESCSDTPVKYTVKVVNCGVVSTYSGTLSPGDADQGERGSGKEVAQIQYVPCSGFSVAGRATYDDYRAELTGLSTSADELPIRSASVEVRQLADDALLAKGETNENGDYAIDFTMQTPGKYYVRVIAFQDNDGLRQQVTNSSGVIYAIQSAELDAALNSRVSNADIRAKRNGTYAEAFNIFDIGLRAFKEAASHSAGRLPLLTWEWTKGRATCGGTASCYSHASKKIFVLSSRDDEDAYDDSVLAHEFGHFFMQHLSAEDSPGGPHSSSDYSNPRLAWSEGAATFFGQQVMRNPQYVDTGAIIRSLNIEELPSRVRRGTEGSALNGKVSEGTVAAVLWDLADNAQDSVLVGSARIKDVVSNPDGVFATLLGMKGGTDRAFLGPDLVDFIDIYLCNGYATWEANAGSNFRGLVTVINDFPYTAQGKPTCRATTP